MRRIVTAFLSASCLLSLLASCEGMFSGIYDEPDDNAAVKTSKGQLYVDATSWTDWYYIDFDSLQMLAADSDSAALERAQTHFTAYPIPVKEGDGTTGNDSSGIYTYWFDVFNKGLSVYELRSFQHTGGQPEPEHWSIAVHRQEVRTNGGEVLKTSYTSMDQLPETSEEFHNMEFTPDEWSERDVWTDNSRMLTQLIGCQGIKINKVLSSWITVHIPPIPPSYTSDSHVFIIRFPNGKYAAVQLQDYVNDQGVRCWLTINYRYPF